MTSEVKRHRVRLVLGWGIAWEDLRVLSAFCLWFVRGSLGPRTTRRELDGSRVGGMELAWLRWAWLGWVARAARVDRAGATHAGHAEKRAAGCLAGLLAGMLAVRTRQSLAEPNKANTEPRQTQWLSAG